MILLQTRLAYLVFIAFPIFYIGIGGKFPWIMLGKHGIDIGMAVFFTLCVLFVTSIFFKLEKIKHTSLNLIFQINIFLALIFILLFDYIQYNHFRLIGYSKPYILYFLDTLFIIYFIIKKPQIKQLIKILIIFVFLHNIFSIYYFPLVKERSDMLLAIMGSLNNFFTSSDPYHLGIDGIGNPPYLPVTILSFTPAYFLKIDPRIIGTCYTVLTMILVLPKLEKLNILNQYLVILAFLNPYWIMRHDLYFQFFLLELTVIFLYLGSFNKFFRILTFGVTLATLQFAVLIFPFILLSYNKKTLPYILEALTTIMLTLVIVLIFTKFNVQSFIIAMTQHKEYTTSYNNDITFGLATIFHFAKNQIPLYIFQISGCILLLLIALINFIFKQNRNPLYYSSIAVICYCFFVFTNYFLETYLFIPIILIISISNYSKIEKAGIC